MIFLILALSATALAQPEEGSSGGSLPGQASQIADDVARLQNDSGGTARISRNQATGVASFVRLTEPGAFAENLPDAAGDLSAGAKSAAFFNQYGGLFGISNPRAQLANRGSKTDNYGLTQLTYQQLYKGVEVFAGVMRTHFNKAGQLTAVNGTFVPDLDLSVVPARSPAEAAAVAIETVAKKNGLRAVSSDIAAVSNELLVFRTGLVQGVPGSNHLAYEVEVANESLTIREFVYVDAHTGKVLDQITGIHEDLDRKVSETTLGNVIWEDSNGDPDPISAGWGTAQQVIDWQNELDGARETYNLFASMTNGDYLSYDGADAIMRTINNAWFIPCPNATWNGESTNYCSGVTGDDTVAHEWGHAYTEYTNSLIYQWQSGALNESYSDIWGEVVDLVNGRGMDTPDVTRSSGVCSSNQAGANFPGNPTVDTVRWLSGEDDPALVNIPPGSGNALRDLWDPTCFGDPGKVTDSQYYCSSSDSGGVHTNSGVPNHAFALMVDGGSYNGQTISPIGLTKAAHIHWAAQKMLTPASSFQDHADALEAACTALEGTNLYKLRTDSPGGEFSGQSISSADCTEVAEIIDAVELETMPDQCNFSTILDPNAPLLCSAGGTLNTIDLQDFEAGLGGWTVGTRDIPNPPFNTPNWAAVGDLPAGAPAGSLQAAFVADLNIGDCDADDETGVLYMDSPVINIPAGAGPRLAFDHWVATELNYDGGNLKASVNGGPFTLVPAAAFDFNPYNQDLAIALNSNPLAGQPAFTGKDGGLVGGSWGQSQVDLSGIAGPGDQVVLRYDFGLDGCTGQVGWYVDNVHTYSCEVTQNSGTVSGKVTESGNGPIEGATVSADTGQSDATAADGTYTITNVPAGSRTITASESSYITQQQATNVTDGNTNTVDFALDPLPAAGTLQVTDFVVGSVSAPKGKWDAMVNVTVRDNLGNLVDKATVNGSWTPASTVGNSCTTTVSGQCSLAKTGIKKSVNSVTFTVEGIGHETLVYSGPDSSIIVHKDGPPADQPPTADNKSISTPKGVPVEITLTASDPETCELAFSIVSGPSHGTLSTLTDQACLSGSPHNDSALVTYTPDLDYDGFDSFKYKANDGAADSNDATVSLTVGTVVPADPVIDEENGCLPSSGNVGDRMTVDVFGNNFQNGATVDFGTRVAVQNVSFDSAGHLAVQIKIHRWATAGLRNVIVTNPDGGSGVGVGCFTVN